MFADVFGVKGFAISKRETEMISWLSRVVQRFDWTGGFPPALIDIYQALLSQKQFYAQPITVDDDDELNDSSDSKHRVSGAVIQHSCELCSL